MSRASLALVALLTIGCIGIFGYSCATRVQPTAPEVESKVLSSPRQIPAVGAKTAAKDTKPPSRHSEAEAELASQGIPADTVTKWIAEATGDDAKARAAAIVALANAPRSQAIPILQRVLNAGEPLVDRQLALNSLRTLGHQQGDEDGSIRNVLRQAIYHGDDEAVARGAQDVLDDIEGARDQASPNAS